MSKSILVIEIDRLQIELKNLIDKMNNIQDDDIYGSKRIYIGYKIELLKRDILIEQLMLPARQKAMLEPTKPLIIDKNLIDGIYISKEKATELLEALEELKNRFDEFYGCPPNYDDELKITFNKLRKALGGKDE